MNDNDNRGEFPNSEVPGGAADPTPPQHVHSSDAGVHSGHSIPNAFGSHQTPPGWQAPYVAQPHSATQSLSANQPHSVNQPHHAQPHQTQPQPAPYGAPAAATGERAAEKTGNGPVKIAGLVLAAALVGGVAGFGGGAIGVGMLDQPTSQSASAPETVTVNNPGSVNETTAIATHVLPSVVTIEVAGSSGSGSGSGVILDKQGHVLTNTHVVTLGGAAANPAIRVTTSDGHIYEATVVGTDPVYDLAVIKLKDPKNLTPIEFADSGRLNVGDTAVAVGAPLGLSNSVTTGIVSALNRSIQVASSALPDNGGSTDQQPGEGDNGNGGPFQFDIPGMGTQKAKQSISIAVIQTDAAINPGNSGGALVDSKGRLIGINVAIATAGGSSSSGESGSIGLGFAIPANIAHRVSDEIIQSGAATHGLLGATVRDASSVENATVAGAAIIEPTENGPAEAAGLTAGDVVTEFNGVPITGASDLTAQVRAAAAGSKAELSYVRDGKTYQIEVTLGSLKL